MNPKVDSPRPPPKFAAFSTCDVVFGAQNTVKVARSDRRTLGDGENAGLDVADSHHDMVEIGCAQLAQHLGIGGVRAQRPGEQWRLFLDDLGSLSTPTTSWPRATSSTASLPPKRPRPMTSISSSCRPLRRRFRSAKERPSFRVLVQRLTVSEHERSADGQGAKPSHEHDRGQDQLPEGGEAGRDAGRESDGVERR